MNEHDIEEFIGPRSRSIVVLLLIVVSTNENIAQAANDERPTFVRTRDLQQRQDLVRKFLSSKREELNEDHHRPQVIESDSNHLLATIESALDRDSFVMTDKLVRFVDAEWRQI